MNLLFAGILKYNIIVLNKIRILVFLFLLRLIVIDFLKAFSPFISYLLNPFASTYYPWAKIPFKLVIKALKELFINFKERSGELCQLLIKVNLNKL
jgi:hypothetical protein